MEIIGRINVDAWGLDARVKTFRAVEGLSMVTEIQLELDHDDPNLDLSSALWTPASIVFEDGEGTLRRAFHGLVVSASFAGERSRRYRYGLCVRPSMDRLSQCFRSHIFQDKSVKDVVTQVLREAGVEAIDWRVSFDYAPREYCVQYKETSLSFVKRLLEDEGIFYWFEHTVSGHTLCFGDDASAFSNVPEDAEFVCSESAAAGDQSVSQLRLRTRRVHSGYRARDWNWLNPAQPVEGEQQDDAGTGLLYYEFPAGAGSSIGAARVASDRRQALALKKHELSGRTSNGRLAPGHKLTLQEAAPAYIDGEYLLFKVTHHYEDASERGADVVRGWSYVADFSAVPAAVGFRPARVTPRPRIAGTEVAVITGPAGEEIHVDEHGRVKVHFYWDREHAADEKSSCYVRVQQQNTHGAMLLPRIGWEVAVGFLWGDPDRPVVLDKRYNANTLPPYALPASLSQAALETMSTGGGGGVSGIRLQDVAGGQGFFVTSQRDLQWTVGNNETETVTVDASASIGANSSTQVGSAETITVGGNQRISVTGAATFNTGSDKQVSVDGQDQLSVKHNRAFTCDGDRNDTVGSAMIVVANNVDEAFNADSARTIGGALVFATPSGSLVEAVGGSKTETIGAAKVEIVTGDHSEVIGASKALTSGASSYKAGGAFDLAVKESLSISAANWTEKCGKDFGFSGKTLVIDAKDGLTSKASGTKFSIKSGKIEIDGSGFGAKGGPQLSMKGKINFKS